MKNNSILLTIILVVLVGAGAFFGGMKYQESKQSSSSFSQRFGGGTTGGRGQLQGNRSGLRPVSGEIISADDSSITVKLQDGSSKIIFLSAKTTILKTDQAAKTDLKSGVSVAVFGQENTDGTMTAQNIQLNPISRGMLGNPNGQNSPNPSTSSGK